MKRIMLILISVVMLFTACKESSAAQPEQVCFEENFNGITFGMTKEEVITILGREPDHVYESNIKYENQMFFDVTTYYVNYMFDENSNLYCILASYTYFDESEKDQMPIDLDHVKEEFSKYYPKNTLVRIDEIDNVLFLSTENRLIGFRTFDSSFDVTIRIRD